MELKEVFEKRRSAQVFDPAGKVTEEQLREIYRLAAFAPSSFNLQPWKILLVSSDEGKKKLQECAFNQVKVTQAAHNLVFLGDKKGYEKMDPILDDLIAKGQFPEANREMMKGMAGGLYGGDSERTSASRNVGLLAMSIMYAASSVGVASHPMDGFDAAKLRETFNIPDNYETVMIVALGLKDANYEPKARGARRPFDEAVVKETF